MSGIYSSPRTPAIAKTRSLQDRNRPDSDLGDGNSKEPVKRSAAVVIAVTLQRLLDNSDRSWSVEENLVLDALRRSAGELNEASESELAEYIGSLSGEQLRGVVSNVKGIYHELLFVHAENLDPDEVSARVFEATNHPGADVEFVVNGDVIDEIQLKAVASKSSIYEHLERYPEIQVLATEEVANQLPSVESSGFSNTEITDDVNQVFTELDDDTLTEEILEGAGASLLVTGAVAAAQVLRSGKVSHEQFKSAFKDVSVGVVTATALDVLLGG